jgi:uncharacterized protein YjiK
VTGTQGVIQTVVGTGTAGYNGNGLAGTSTSLGGLGGVAVDRSGNVYISDISSNVVLMYTVATRIVNIVAGSIGTQGPAGDGGPATSAGLNTPSAVAVDYAGNIYILEFYSNVIRVVSGSTSIISTYAGTGMVGSLGDGGLASQAQLSTMQAIAVDPVGNLYIADSNNNRVRRVCAATKIISTIAGTGTAGNSGDGSFPWQAMLNGPAGVAIDNSGNVYISDGNNQKIRSFTGKFHDILRKYACIGT